MPYLRSMGPMSGIPAGMSIQHWVEHRIEQARKEGQFDHLGSGPIHELDKPYREGWWVERLIERERLHEVTRTPTGIAAIRAELDELHRLSDEDAVRSAVSGLNERLGRHAAVLGLRLPRIDAEAMVRRWRDRRGNGGGDGGS